MASRFERLDPTSAQVAGQRLAHRVMELRQALRRRDLAALAANSGASWEDGRFRLQLWGSPVQITLPDLVARDEASGVALDIIAQALLAYYLHTADGTPPADEWIAFTDLPDGRFYTQAFQGYTGRELAGAFGHDLALFGAAAVASGGQPAPFATTAYHFQALPRVPLLVACWPGDEDFPSSYQILFDARVDHYLPTDGCAIIGSMLTRRLLQQRPRD